MTTNEEVQAALQAPFADGLIEWKPDPRSGTELAYVHWTHYQQRLDDVVGPHWHCDVESEETDFECTVTVRYPDGTEAARTDVGVDDEITVKATGEVRRIFGTGRAQAFKRACVGHGIGRYLYMVKPRKKGQGKSSNASKPEWSPRPPTKAAKEVANGTNQPGHPSTHSAHGEATMEQVDQISMLGQDVYGRNEWFGGINTEVAVWASTKSAGKSGEEKRTIGSLTKEEAVYVIKSLQGKMNKEIPF